MPGSRPSRRCTVVVALCVPLSLCAVPAVSAQVFIVEPAHIEQHYASFQPTSIKLPPEPLNTVGREELIRFLQSEQGFAMRPLPIANLDLRANGPMEPTGEKYIDELHAKGISVKPGDRVVVTDIKIRERSIVLELNNGPEHKHRILRHISIGMSDAPIANNLDGPPTGSRVTLVFPGRVPDLTGEQVEALLKPMIDFGVKSPAEAYAESLPPFLEKAILEHRILIGMDRDMVRYAKGEPARKVRETENGQAFEIWIYGEVPQPVEFVRFVGDFVVRDELARVGEPMLVRTANEMGDFWGNQPVVAANQHEIELGDRTSADATQENAPKAPPTLRAPGEKLPTDNDKNQPTMQPVNFPPGMQRPGDPGYTPTISAKQPSGCPQTASSASATPPTSGTATPPASGTAQQPACGSSQSSGSGSGSSPGTTAPAQQPAATTPPPAAAPQLVPSSQ